MSNFSPNSRVRKPVVRTTGGVVAAQHVGAASVGAMILQQGGNAIDAAVATSFALGVLEPWMSGIGGGGLMVVRHPDGAVNTIDFGMRAPAGLDVADYPAEEGETEGLFTWPSVKDDRNMIGAKAIAVPGVVDGIGTAHSTWGTKPWEDLLSPAIDLARRGISVDWYTTMIVAQAARVLAQWPASVARFLRDGHPPQSSMTPTGDVRLPMEALARTLEILAREGHRSFYDGPLATELAAEVQGIGGSLGAGDLAGYHAQILDPLVIDYRDATVWATPELSAGPTLADVLRRHESWDAVPGATPDGSWFASMGQSLSSAYETRLERMGDVDDGRSVGCTSHFSVSDRSGMTVSVTQTLLSVFGSMVTLPGTGVLMNNGIYWFDPRPDRPNSLGPSKRCLANMCPVILGRGDGAIFGLGASGGRRILPAVAQAAAFLTDFDMDLEDALHHPRIDVSGSEILLADAELPDLVVHALSERFETHVKKRSVYPSWFANLSATGMLGPDRVGGSEPTLPWADAVAEVP